MQKGKVARIMDKGYGFIKAEGVEKDLFFHANVLQNAEFDTLKEDDDVEFEMVDSPKGPQAANVNKM